MSRFGKESGPRRKSELRASKRTRLSLAALLVGFTMVVASATIVGSASAAGATVVQVPTNPTPVNDPCGPNNASWGVIPADADIQTADYLLDFHFNADNTRVLVSIVDTSGNGPYAFPDGTITHDFGTAPDSGVACATIVDVPAQPGVTNPPGPNNATWNVPSNDSTFNWSVDGNGHLIVTIVASNTTFPDGSTTHDYGVAPDSDQPVTVVDVPAQPTVNDPCNPAGVSDNVTWNVPADTTAFAWTVLNNGDLRVTIKPANTTFPGGATSHDYTKPADSGVACDNGGGTGGDNGTVKTHNVGTSTTDVNDEPNLACGGFYLDAFGFDGVQQVSWYITSDTHGDTVLSGNITLDGNGHGYTANLNLPNGMYKLYWHFQGQNGADKHKVFKVEGCTPQVTKIDVPAQPTVTDACGPNNATWNVPANTDVLHWAVNGAGHLIVTIVVDNTQFLDGSLTHDFGTAPDSGAACPGNTQVTPASPTATQPSCKLTYKTVSHSSQEGVVWNYTQVTLKVGESVTFTASPAEGYEFPKGAQVSWSFTNDFNTKSCNPGTHNHTGTGHVVGPQLGTGSGGPTSLNDVSTTSSTLLYAFAGLLAMLGLSLSGGGMLVLSRVRRGAHRS